MCDREGIWLQKLSPQGDALGAAVETGVALGDWEPAAPFYLQGRRDGAALLYASDGDQLIQTLDASGRSAGPPRLVLVQADGLAPRRVVTRPGPAWLELAARGRRLSLITFGAADEPKRRVDLPLPGLHGSLFGKPALWGGPEGYAVAYSTLDRLFFARLAPDGRPLGPAHGVPLRYAGSLDPRCSVIARTELRFYSLTVGRHPSGAPVAVLAGFGVAGPFAGPAVALDFPLPVMGCHLALLPTPARLVVVALVEPAKPGGAAQLMLAEFGRDGHRVERPQPLALAKRFSGVVAVPGGALVVWEAPSAAKKEHHSGAIMAARLRCR